VRRMEERDFDAWFELFDSVSREGRWIGYDGPVDREERRRTFDRSLDAKWAARFVAEVDGELVGEVAVHLQLGVADLGMLVREGHRGQGIGSALMEACIEWCRGSGAHKIALSVFPHNDAGLALYRKFGFAEEGRQVRHYRRRSGELWDAILMGLVLDEEAPGSPYPDGD
jgi:RimJ/RimL family protein N-acetyltransferase